MRLSSDTVMQCSWRLFVCRSKLTLEDIFPFGGPEGGPRRQGGVKRLNPQVLKLKRQGGMNPWQ